MVSALALLLFETLNVKEPFSLYRFERLLKMEINVMKLISMHMLRLRISPFLDSAPPQLEQLSNFRENLRLVEEEARQRGIDLETLWQKAQHEYDVWPRTATPALDVWHSLEDMFFARTLRGQPRPEHIHLVWVEDGNNINSLSASDTSSRKS